MWQCEGVKEMERERERERERREGREGKSERVGGGQAAGVNGYE